MKSTPVKTFQAIIFLFAFLVLSACSKPAAPAPTPEMDTIETKAAQTLEAFSTATALTIPTETPFPTYTPFVPPSENINAEAITLSDIPEDNSSAMEIEESAPAEPVSQIAVQAEPASAAVSEGTNKATWQSQNPQDGTHVEAGSEFDITWYMYNSGTATWTTDYCMRYFAGTNMTKPGKTRYNLSEPVAPGTVGACSVDAVAPWSAGTYQMSVVLSNENDENFSIVDITIVVD